MYDFLWDGKPDNICRKTIIQNYENCGLKNDKYSRFYAFIESILDKKIEGITESMENSL